MRARREQAPAGGRERKRDRGAARAGPSRTVSLVEIHADFACAGRQVGARGALEGR